MVVTWWEEGVFPSQSMIGKGTKVLSGQRIGKEKHHVTPPLDDRKRYKKPDYVPIFKGAASRRVMLEIFLGWGGFKAMLFRRWELGGVLKSSMSAYIYIYIYTTIYTDRVSTEWFRMI